jgi:hypothetical protein
MTITTGRFLRSAWCVSELPAARAFAMVWTPGARFAATASTWTAMS